MIGREDHDDVGPLGGVGDGEDFEAGLLRLIDRLAGGGQADADIDARVLEIERMGMALRAVADDGYLLLLDKR